MAETVKTVEILLVEDNPIDVLVTKEALAEATIGNNVHVVGDGVEAMAFLSREGKYIDSPRPDLILLDLNLPRKDGREVLAELKGSPGLKRIPVIILTTSKSDEDIVKSYDLHANCFITKPVDLDHFIHIIRSIENFWFTIVSLPAD